jgi:hypothetical protein
MLYVSFRTELPVTAVNSINFFYDYATCGISLCFNMGWLNIRLHIAVVKQKV